MTTKTDVKRIETERRARRPRRLLIHWPADYAGPHAGCWTEGPRELKPEEAARLLADAGTQRIMVEYTADWPPGAPLAAVVRGEEANRGGSNSGTETDE